MHQEGDEQTAGLQSDEPASSDGGLGGPSWRASELTPGVRSVGGQGGACGRAGEGGWRLPAPAGPRARVGRVLFSVRRELLVDLKAPCVRSGETALRGP